MIAIVLIIMHFLWYRKASENVVKAIKCLNLISILVLRVKACIDHASFIVNKPKASAQFLTGLKLLPTPFSVPWPSLSVVKGEACSEWILTFHGAVHFSFLTFSLFIYKFFLNLSVSETFRDLRNAFQKILSPLHEMRSWLFLYICSPYSTTHLFSLFFSLK